MRKRKIAIVTSSRADFGHQLPVLKELFRRKNLKPLVWVTGSHLLSGNTRTLDEIRRSKIKISNKVPIFSNGTEPSKAIATGLNHFDQLIKRNKPDLVVIFGDRFEMLAPALAATFNRVPLAHMHGGESSAGAFDELVRHSLTKLSSLHFAAAKDYRRRLLQMGENPKNTFYTGAPGVETILSTPRISKSELAKQLNIPADKPWISFSYHPPTRGRVKSELADLLKEITKLQNYFVLVSAANSDPAGKQVNKALLAWVKKHSKQAQFFWNLGHDRYINALRHSVILVGNSSSGIIEAPLLGVASINVGDRQAGRLRSPSIVDSGSRANDIRRSLRIGLSKRHQQKSKKKQTPYSKKGAHQKIVDILAGKSLHDLDQKPFFDLKIGKRK